MKGTLNESNNKTNRPSATEVNLTELELNSTTSFLTATILIYATGAGITAAAGTRLALQLILVKSFRLHSFPYANPCG